MPRGCAEIAPRSRRDRAEIAPGPRVTSPRRPVEQALLPQLAFAQEGFVSKLANPADRSAASLLLASVAPCVGAPLFEEVQSRAFMLQAIGSFVPLRAGGSATNANCKRLAIKVCDSTCAPDTGRRPCAAPSFIERRH